jgi:hypothetical protein
MRNAHAKNSESGRGSRNIRILLMREVIASPGRKSTPKVRRKAKLTPSGGYHATMPGKTSNECEFESKIVKANR